MLSEQVILGSVLTDDMTQDIITHIHIKIYRFRNIFLSFKEVIFLIDAS